MTGDLPHLPHGPRDELITAAVAEVLERVRTAGAALQQRALDPEEASAYLADHLRRILERCLDAVPAAERPQLQVALANQLIDDLITQRASAVDEGDTHHDVPRLPDLAGAFHWESQSTTRQSSPTGRRYLDGSSRILLFVRERKTGAAGSTMPYLCLGPVTLVDAHGDRPIAITWRLHEPLPQSAFDAATTLVA